MISHCLFLWRRKRAGERFVLYTVDTEAYASSALGLFGMPLFSEMHGGKPGTLAQRLLFAKASGIIAINRIIVEELRKRFPRSPARYLVEPNGVDLAAFAGTDKRAARARLGLPPDATIVLYAGRFFEWKGLEILPRAARAAPELRWQIVGGERADFERLVKEPPPENLFFAGSRPHGEMVLWFSAADALVVLGTARDVQSYRYTSPMKLFEYLAAGRPVVASGTPAIREIVSEREVVFYEPDNAESLARSARQAVSPSVGASRIAAAKAKAAASSWRARGARILAFMEETAGVRLHA